MPQHQPRGTPVLPAARDADQGISLRDCLVRVAVHAAAEGDAAFFRACEDRWRRTFAPDGPRLADVIGDALELALPEEETLTLRR